MIHLNENHPTCSLLNIVLSHMSMHTIDFLIQNTCFFIKKWRSKIQHAPSFAWVDLTDADNE